MGIHHRIVIIGGGNAGLSVAARLRHKGLTDIAVIEPQEKHYYQPLWTLVGGGCAKADESVRAMASVMPQGVAWIKDSATGVDPEKKTVSLASGTEVGYDYLVVAPGIQIDWEKIPGLLEAVEGSSASCNYRFDLAPKTWDLIRRTRSGTAVFTLPNGAIKCAGAPQKIAYLACDYWRQQGVLDRIRVVLVLPMPGMFGVPEFAQELERKVAEYGIEVLFESEATEVRPAENTVVVRNNRTQETQEIKYDMAHLVPPQSAPDWIKKSPLADPDNPAGYVQVDKHTLQHTRFPEIFSLGDACSTPNSKTGAAIRKQAPVLVKNLLAVMQGKTPSASYSGYASCPLTTSRSTMLLAEFDYSGRPAPSFPFIDTTKERKDMWYLKRYILPAMYWNTILSGRM